MQILKAAEALFDLCPSKKMSGRTRERTRVRFEHNSRGAM